MTSDLLTSDLLITGPWATVQDAALGATCNVPAFLPAWAAAGISCETCASVGALPPDVGTWAVTGAGPGAEAALPAGCRVIAHASASAPMASAFAGGA